MSDKNIEIALSKRLNAMTPALPTAWPNKPLKPSNTSAWQKAALLRADNKTPFTGTTGPTLRRGIMVVTLYYPPGTGSGAALDRAVALQAQFARGLVLTQGGDRVTIAEKPSIQPALPEAEWYALPVHIPFYSYG